jgi:outer membrane protein TolC
MRLLLLLILVSALAQSGQGQRIGQRPDSLRKRLPVSNQAKGMPVNSLEVQQQLNADKLNPDSLIRLKLVDLVAKNPDMAIADANITIAGYDLDRAKKSWMSSITAGANINEFVIRNSPAASFFPKYNLGVAIPFDILSKTKRERKVAEQNIDVAHYMKQAKLQALKTEVLIRYENYKEKKELVRLQITVIDNDLQAYEAAQKSYADGRIEIEVMNRAYQLYVNEQAKLISKEKDLTVAILQVEELIGMPLNEAIQAAITLK